MRDTRAYPYGYEMINGVIVINTAEAEVVKQIYSDRLSGIGVYAIGKKLYEMQIPYFSEERDKAIKKAGAILYKSVYCGERRYPAIIDRCDFDAVQAMKTAAFRKKKNDSDDDKPVRIDELSVSYVPTAEVTALEEKLNDILEATSNTDSTAIRAMIFELVRKKYACITEEE